MDAADAVAEGGRLDNDEDCDVDEASEADSTVVEGGRLDEDKDCDVDTTNAAVMEEGRLGEDEDWDVDIADSAVVEEGSLEDWKSDGWEVDMVHNVVESWSQMACDIGV